MASPPASEGALPPPLPPGGGGARAPVTIVGAGAVGSALARRLRAARYPVAAVLSRSERSARALAAEVEAPVASPVLEALPEATRLLLLCVPDDQVRPVSAALARQEHPWARCLAAHTAGALPATALRPLAEAGATTLSFHPLQTFTKESGAGAFDGIYVGLEGDGVAAGRALAEALGLRSLALTPSAKARYHLAASMASNFLVTLASVAGDVLSGALDEAPGEASGEGTREDRSRGRQRADAASGGAADGKAARGGAAALYPLLEGTLRNLQQAPTPAAALTGPVARGDVETVALHLRALRAHHPSLLPAYAALATETVRLATARADGDGLPADTAARLLDRLAAALEQHERE